MIPYLTNTADRLWAIFEQTVPNWSTLVRPGNQIEYRGPLKYPPQVLAGRSPGKFPGVSIVPTDSTDQAYKSPMARTFGSMDAGAVGGSAIPLVIEESTTFEIMLTFADLNYPSAETLYLAMRTALMKAGPHLALVAPATPTAPGLSYVSSWGPLRTTRGQKGADNALRLVQKTQFVVNYRFQTADLA